MSQFVNEMEPLLVSIPDAARLLSVTARSVAERVKLGVFVPVRLGRRVLIRMADLRAFAAGETVKKETSNG